LIKILSRPQLFASESPPPPPAARASLGGTFINQGTRGRGELSGPLAAIRVRSVYFLRILIVLKIENLSSLEMGTGFCISFIAYSRTYTSEK